MPGHPLGLVRLSRANRISNGWGWLFARSPQFCRTQGAHKRAQFFLSCAGKTGTPSANKLANDHRDEDRDAPAGFESRAERVREFAAGMAMQAYALLAAAEGTVSAYKEITGEDWKAYQAPAQGPATVDRRSADAQLSALAG